MGFFSRNRFRLKIMFYEEVLKRACRERVYDAYYDIKKLAFPKNYQSNSTEKDLKEIFEEEPVEEGRAYQEEVVEMAINIERKIRFLYQRKLRVTFDVIHY